MLLCKLKGSRVRSRPDAEVGGRDRLPDKTGLTMGSTENGAGERVRRAGELGETYQMFRTHPSLELSFKGGKNLLQGGRMMGLSRRRAYSQA